MSEIPIENMPAALAARLDCPVPSCNGVVRLGLLNGSIGDQAGWACDLDDYHQWREDGKPRWQIELTAAAEFAPSARQEGERR